MSGGSVWNLGIGALWFLEVEGVVFRRWVAGSRSERTVRTTYQTGPSKAIWSASASHRTCRRCLRNTQLSRQPARIEHA